MCFTFFNFHIYRVFLELPLRDTNVLCSVIAPSFFIRCVIEMLAKTEN